MSEQEQAAVVREEEYGNGVLLWAPFQGKHFGVFVGTAEDAAEETGHEHGAASNIDIVYRLDATDQWQSAPMETRDAFGKMLNERYVGVAQYVGDEGPLAGADEALRRIMRKMITMFVQGAQ